VLAEIAATSRPAPAPKPTPESEALRAFQVYEFNSVPVGPVVEQTPRARAIREINRIATWYGWPGEITRALDAAAATSLAGLADEELEQLVERMRHLEECVQNGGDAPDAPPAR